MNCQRAGRTRNATPFALLPGLRLCTCLCIYLCLFSAAPALAAEPTSVLVVSSKPAGAQVSIDRELVGRTPVSKVLAPGAHELEVRAPGYVRYLTVILADGSPIVLDIDLRPDPDTAAFKPSTQNETKIDPAQLEGWPNEWLGMALSIGVPIASVAVGIPMLFVWDVGVNVAGVAMMGQGLLLGGSAGHMYAGLWQPTLVHSGIRLATIGTAVGGAALYGGFLWWNPQVAAIGGVMLVLGATATLGSLIYESVVTVKNIRTAKLKNAKRAGSKRERRWVLDASPLVATPWGSAFGATVSVIGW